jgi:hypothetical protein
MKPLAAWHNRDYRGGEDNGLANRRLQPLGHLSGPPGMPQGLGLGKQRSASA